MHFQSKLNLYYNNSPKIVCVVITSNNTNNYESLALCSDALTSLFLLAVELIVAARIQSPNDP